MLRVYYLDELTIEEEKGEREREIERESKKKIKSLLKG